MIRMSVVSNVEFFNLELWIITFLFNNGPASLFSMWAQVSDETALTIWTAEMCQVLDDLSEADQIIETGPGQYSLTPDFWLELARRQQTDAGMVAEK